MLLHQIERAGRSNVTRAGDTFREGVGRGPHDAIRPSPGARHRVGPLGADTDDTRLRPEGVADDYEATLRRSHRRPVRGLTSGSASASKISRARRCPRRRGAAVRSQNGSSARPSSRAPLASHARLIEIPAELDQGGSECAYRSVLVRIVAERHDHHARNAVHAGGERDRLPVIAGARRNHATYALIRRQRRDEIEAAADLEGARRIVVLVFDLEFEPRFGSQQRMPHQGRRDGPYMWRRPCCIGHPVRGVDPRRADGIPTVAMARQTPPSSESRPRAPVFLVAADGLSYIASEEGDVFTLSGGARLRDPGHQRDERHHPRHPGPGR